MSLANRALLRHQLLPSGLDPGVKGVEVDVPHHLLALRRRHAAVVPHAHEARTVAAGSKSDLSLGNGFVKRSFNEIGAKSAKSTYEPVRPSLEPSSPPLPTSSATPTSSMWPPTWRSKALTLQSTLMLAPSKTARHSSHSHRSVTAVRRSISLTRFRGASFLCLVVARGFGAGAPNTGLISNLTAFSEP